MPSVLSFTSRRLPPDEILPDTGGQHQAPGAQPHPDRLAQRRQKVRQPGLPHPVAQVQGVAVFHQQDVCLSNPGDPAFFVDAGQRGELQHSQGLPTQLAHGGSGFSSADETPCPTRIDVGVPVRRGGDAEGVGVGDRFTQEVDQRVVDTSVLDACGREKKLQDASRVVTSGTLRATRRSLRRSASSARRRSRVGIAMTMS